MNDNNTVLTTGEILALERRSAMSDDEAIRYSRAIERAVIAKLGQPAASETKPLRDAATAVVRKALDAAEVHPCDANDDNVRAATLYGPMRDLYDALKARPAASEADPTIRNPLIVASESGAVPVAWREAIDGLMDFEPSHGVVPCMSRGGEYLLKADVIAALSMLDAAPAAQPEKQAGQTFEQRHAIKEGERNEAERKYFEARPHMDTTYWRQVFCDGFDRGYDAAPPAPSQQAAPAAEPTDEMVSRAWLACAGACDHPTIRHMYRTMMECAPAAESAEPADPMDWPLPCDVTVGHGTARKGTKLRTLVARMKVLYEMAQPSAATADAQVDKSTNLQRKSVDESTNLQSQDAQGDERAREHIDSLDGQLEYLIGRVKTIPSAEMVSLTVINIRERLDKARAALSRRPSVPASAGDVDLPDLKGWAPGRFSADCQCITVGQAKQYATMAVYRDRSNRAALAAAKPEGGAK